MQKEYKGSEKSVKTEKVRIGVFGGGRGISMIEFCTFYDEAELVAICDMNEKVLEDCRKFLKKYDKENSVTLYKTFDEFIEHDMDAVVLANFATEHAPYAIRCLDKGLHVLSDISPVQCMKEAVELVEAVERSGKVYAFGENCCYFPGVMKMRENYRAGKYGKVLYAEGEYIHDCSSIWHKITYGDRNHWRNRMYATFYCTHSIGPIIHITGEKPVSVVGYELPLSPRLLDLGYLKGTAGIEMITTESGAVIRSTHGDMHKYGLWYSLYGTLGAVETDRKGEHAYNIVNEWFEEKLTTNAIEHELNAANKMIEMHGGADYYEMHYFIDKILGRDDGGQLIDVYEALDMFLPGLIAYKSVFQGNIPLEVPDLRKKEMRDKYRNDVWCVDPKVAGDQVVPSYSKGNPEIPDSVYEKVAQKYKEECEKAEEQN